MGDFNTDSTDGEININEALDSLQKLLAKSVEFSTKMTEMVVENDIKIQVQNKVGSSFGKIQ